MRNSQIQNIVGGDGKELEILIFKIAIGVKISVKYFKNSLRNYRIKCFNLKINNCICFITGFVAITRVYLERERERPPTPTHSQKKVFSY